MKRRIVLLGPPASGKGTQAELMKAKYQLPVVSPGAMLREEKARGTTLGLEADRLTSQGQLVPDATIIALVESWLGTHREGFVFDGFPRTEPQALALDEILAQRGTPLQVALSLETSVETLQGRVARRLVCMDCGSIVALGWQVRIEADLCPQCEGPLSRRRDDTPEVLRQRLEQYRAKSEPLISYYRERDLLHSVECSGAPAEVFATITTILEAA